MSESELTGATKRLLDAAKNDGPSAARRARMWDGVATTAKVGSTGAILGGAGAGLGAAATASSAKGAVITAILGGIVTIGLAVALLVARPPTPAAPAAVDESAPNALDARGKATSAGGGVADVASAESAANRANAAPAAGASIPTAPVAPASVVRAAADCAGPAPLASSSTAPALVAAKPAAAAAATAAKVTARRAPVDDLAGGDDNGLMHEAMLVAEARGALVRGDAEGALAGVRAAARLPKRSLEPEELSIEAQSLRALGRVAEAEAAESTLRERFPSHALAR